MWSTRSRKDDLLRMKQQQYLRDQNFSKTGRGMVTARSSVMGGNATSVNFNNHERSRLVLLSRSTIQGGTFDFTNENSIATSAEHGISRAKNKSTYSNIDVSRVMFLKD